MQENNTVEGYAAPEQDLSQQAVAPQGEAVPAKPEVPQLAPGRERGVMARINDKGFGFIKRESGEELFVHTREIKNAPDIRCITPYEKVEFEVGYDKKRPDKAEAQKVYVLDPYTMQPRDDSYYANAAPPAPAYGYGYGQGYGRGGYGQGYGRGGYGGYGGRGGYGRGGYGQVPYHMQRYQPYGQDSFGGRRAGDWDCPNCGAMCFGSKNECFKCGTKKPEGIPDNRRPGDWDCPNCGKVVFGWKDNCFSCNTPKPVANAGAGESVETPAESAPPADNPPPAEATY